MGKPVDLAKLIQTNFEKDWSEEIKEYGFQEIFLSIYNTSAGIEDKNKLACYTIHAYHPDSLWLDLKKDRIDNKIKILSHLGADHKSELYKNILDNRHEKVNIAIFNFLEELKDWRWRSIFDYLEHASRMSRFALTVTPEEKQYDEQDKEGNKQTLKEDIDIKVIVSVNKEKGNLINQSVEARKEADKLLEAIRKEYVATDSATKSDFGISFTETAKKRDPLSWRHYISDLKEKGVAIR